MKPLKLFSIIFCMNILYSFTASSLQANTAGQNDHTLTGTKWVSSNKMEKKEMIIHVEFTGDNTCVFLVEEKFDNGDHYIQPSPNCKYRAIAPHISFTEGKFFDFDMNFYKPVKGTYSENELEITLDNGSIFKFVREYR